MGGHNHRQVLPGEPWNLALLTAREKKGHHEEFLQINLSSQHLLSTY